MRLYSSNPSPQGSRNNEEKKEKLRASENGRHPRNNIIKARHDTHANSETVAVGTGPSQMGPKH